MSAPASRRFLRPIPGGLPFFHPAVLLATWGGSGLLRPASGTWGSLAALPFAWGLAWAGGVWLLAAATVAVTLIGIAVADHLEHASGDKDASAIVIDEVAGQWLTVLPLAALGLFGAWHYAAGFALFRLFDVLKPWPVSWADRQLPGGLGVVLDDVLAGLYAALALILGVLLVGHV